METSTPKHWRTRLSALALVMALFLAACGDATATTAPLAGSTTAPVATTAPAAATTAPVAATTAPASGATTAPAANTTAPATGATTAPSGSATTAPATTGSTNAPAAAFTQDPKGKTGGTITVGYKGDAFKSLDPQVCYDIPCFSVITSLYNGLLAYAPKSTNLVPDLATALPTLSADSLTYTFKLRQGVKFSDGSEVKASDVRYSIERCLQPDVQSLGSGFQGFLLGIVGADEYSKSQAADKKVTEVSGIKTPDDYTVSITLNQADQSFLYALTLTGFVVPKSAVEKAWSADRKTNTFSDMPVGSGPYMVKTYEKGKQLTLVKNPNYSADKLGFGGYVDQIVFQLNVDETTQINRIKAGQMDYTEDGIPASEYTNLLNDAQYKDQVIKTPVVATDYIFMNTTMKPFDNVKVRQAFEYIFNKAKMNQLLNNRGTVAKGVQPPLMPGYSESFDPGYKYDVAKAKQLLTEAGFDLNQSITFWATDNDDDQKIGQQAVADMKAAGLTNVSTKFEKSNIFFSDVGKPNTVQMGVTSWFQDFPDPSDFISPILSCATATDGGSNVAFYCNKDVDAKEQAARAEPDRTKRLQQYLDIEKQIMQDAPWIPWRNRFNVDFNSKTLGGYYYHPAQYVVFRQYWKTDGK